MGVFLSDFQYDLVFWRHGCAVEGLYREAFGVSLALCFFRFGGVQIAHDDTPA